VPICTLQFQKKFLQYHYTVMPPTTPAAKQKAEQRRAAKKEIKRKEVKQWKIANKTAKARSTSPGVTPSAPRPLSKGAATFMAQQARKTLAAKTYKEEYRKTLAAKDYQKTYQEEYRAKWAELHYEDLRANASFIQLGSDIGMSPSDAEAQQKLVLERQEIVRQDCEKKGTMFYSGVMGVDMKAVQVLYPHMELTAKVMCSAEFVQTLNVDLNAGKIALESIGYGPPEHVRFLAGDKSAHSQGVFCVSHSSCL
jgi:hypothetical protein